MTLRRAFVLSMLLLAPALLGASDASTAPMPPTATTSASALTWGESATYEIVLDQPRLLVIATLEPETIEACEDGFGVTRACARFGMTYRLPERSPVTFYEPFHIDMASSELVSWGNWPVDGTSGQQFFATTSPLWFGHPAFVIGDASDQFINAVRTAILGGLLIGQAARHSADVTFAQMTGDVSAAPGAIVARFPPTAPLSRYEIDVDPGQAFATRVDAFGANGSLVARALRTAYAPGSGGVDLRRDAPLDYPTVRSGVPTQAWTTSPPDSGEGFLLPLRQAELQASTRPLALHHSLTTPGSYTVRAVYSERATPIEADSPLMLKQAIWTILRGDPALTFQASRVEGRALGGLEAARADVVIEDPERSRPTDPTFVRPRSHMPDALVPVDMAKSLATAYIDQDDDAFSFYWIASPYPEATGTPDAGWYVLYCGLPFQGWPYRYALMSAVNGQILVRATDGNTPCADGDVPPLLDIGIGPRGPAVG